MVGSNDMNGSVQAVTCWLSNKSPEFWSSSRIRFFGIEQKYSWCHVPEIGSVGVFPGGKRLPNGVLRITVTVLLL